MAISVDSKKSVVATEIVVAAGETWRFLASGTWTDWFIASGPAGYENRLADMFDIHPAFPAAPWFCLIGRIAGEPTSAFAIGDGVDHVFAHGGDLEVFANDTPGLYWNNHGAVELTAAKLGAPADEPLVAAPPRAPTAAARMASPAHARSARRAGGLAGTWAGLAELWTRIRGMPFIALLVAATGLVLALTEQGRDLIAAIAEDQDPKSLGLGLAVTFFALQAWYWSRLVVLYSYGSDRDRWDPRWFLVWAPRALGVAVFGFLFLALGLSFRDKSLQPLAPVLVGAFGLAFLVFVICREDVVRQIARRNAAVARALAARPGAGRRRWVQLSLLLALVFWLLATFLPVMSSQTIGPPATVYLAVASIVPVTVSLIHIERMTRLPILAFLGVLAVACSLLPWSWADNHVVGRRAFVVQDPSPAQPLTKLPDAYADWRAQAPSVAMEGKTVTPIIFVASEGGASRAGYWTAETLGALQDATGGRFSKSVFAINSVSGGSVGALGFVASLDDLRAQSGGLAAALEDFSGRDFLSPTLAGFLFPDLTQRFLPVALLPDRAETLERSWEKAWAEHCGGSRPFCDPARLRQPFLSLWASKSSWRPALTIEGASEESGRRVMTSNLVLDASIMDADDFHAQTGQDVRASTAILNGARYTFVSPAGLYGLKAGGGAHIVDGGYFDASGLEMTRELANATLNQPAASGDDTLLPIFLVVGACKDPTVDTPQPARLLADLLAPFVALYNGRDAHGVHIAGRLLQDIGGAPISAACPKTIVTGALGKRPLAAFLPIKLCTVNGQSVPLDWVLSQTTRTRMNRALDPKSDQRCPEAAGNFQTLVDLLNGKGSLPAPPPAAKPPAP